MMNKNCNEHSHVLSSSLIKKTTVQYVQVLKKINPSYRADLMFVPRRTLTQPSVPSKNNGFDNIQDDYILRVKEFIGSSVMYEILELMGQGTFGQVVKCRNTQTNELVAIKVIKRQPSFHMQGEKELSILCILRSRVDQSDRFLQLRDHFLFKGHLCAVFELLSISLHKLFILQQPKKPTMAITDIQKISQSILETLALLKEMKIIHTDLKPDNILIKSKDSLHDVKLIDYGSALLENDNRNYCIQTAFYRSPEVILRAPFDCAIDMWSFGCFVAELFLGEPLFPSGKETTLMHMMVKALQSLPSTDLLQKGRNSNRYFDLEPQAPKNNETAFGVKLRPLVIGSQDSGLDSYGSLRERIMGRDVSYDSGAVNQNTDTVLKEQLYDFIKHILVFNPAERYSPQQALSHPFITEKIIIVKAVNLASAVENPDRDTVKPPMTDSSILAERRLKSILKKNHVAYNSRASQLQNGEPIMSFDPTTTTVLNGGQPELKHNSSRVTFAPQTRYLISVHEERSSLSESSDSSLVLSDPS